MGVTFGQLFLLIIVVWFCTYVIISRICKCFEICMTSKSYNKYLDHLNKEEENKNDTAEPSN